MNNKLYKYSQFNIIVEETGEKVLIFNTYTLNYSLINKSDFFDIYNKTNIDIGDVPIRFNEKGFIVPIDKDEIQTLKNAVKLHYDKADYMFLSIFTTLACNYRCKYCFEKEQLCQTEYMTKETADDIIEFVKTKYKEHQFSKPLIIKWFGGEPLLNMDIIRYISRKLNNNNINFTAKLYTNGFFLTRDLALELKDLGVSGDVVIPIDGLPSTYAKQKGCDESAFYQVVNNIKESEDILKILIHIKVSDASKNDIESLYKLLREQYNIKSQIILTKVDPMNIDNITADNSISYDEYTNIIRMRQKKYIKRAYGCEARYNNYYVIGTQGEMYYCEHLIGQEKFIIGSIKDKYNIKDKSNTIWDTNKAIEDCKDCPILPVCLCGCTTQRYVDNIRCEKDKLIKEIKSIISERAKNIKGYQH